MAVRLKSPTFKNLRHVHTIVKEDKRVRQENPKMSGSGEVPYGIFDGNFIYIGKPGTLHSDVLTLNKDKKPVHMGTFFMDGGKLIHMNTSASVRRDLDPVTSTMMTKLERKLQAYLKEQGMQGVKFERYLRKN